MSATHDEPQGTPQDDPSAVPTAYVTAIMVVVFVITVIGLQAYFGRVRSEERETKLVAPEVQALAAFRAEQDARISGYRAVAPDSGIVGLPIDRAMQLVAQEMAARSPLPPSPAE